MAMRAARAAWVLPVSSHSSTGRPGLLADGFRQVRRPPALQRGQVLGVQRLADHDPPGLVFLGELGDAGGVHRA